MFSPLVYGLASIAHARGRLYTIAHAKGERQGALKREDSIPPTGKVKDANEEVEVYQKGSDSKDGTGNGPIR